MADGLMPDTLAPARVPREKRHRDPAGTRRAILDAAQGEFSDKGLSGARVDAIARRTGTNVRMIYYYFGSKDGLYRAVLAQSYADVREAEQALDLDALPPGEAVAALCRFMFDYHAGHPHFSRLVSIENIHRAEHLRQCDGIELLNQPILAALDRILRRGRAENLFRTDAGALDVHLLMTSFCFFRVANRYTLQAAFGTDPLQPATANAQRRMLVAAVQGFLRPPEDATEAAEP